MTVEEAPEEQAALMASAMEQLGNIAPEALDAMKVGEAPAPTLDTTTILHETAQEAVVEEAEARVAEYLGDVPAESAVEVVLATNEEVTQCAEAEAAINNVIPATTEPEMVSSLIN